MPRKKVTTTEVVSSPIAAAKPRAKVAVSTHKTRTAGVAPSEITAQQIADKAYLNWLDRGSPAGTPEEDWFQAESELLTRAAGA
jgi:Protein of unknown function (DUF2934)